MLVILDALRHDTQASLGSRRATRNVVMRATRHVVATTLTTIIGFIPLLFDPSGFWLGKAALNDSAVIQVTEAPVSKSQENVLPPALAVTLGRILSPLKGVI